MFNKTRISLDEKISSSTKFSGILDFSNHITETYGNINQPVDLLEYCSIRKIKTIEINPNLSHDAFIEIIGNEFKLTTKEELSQNNPIHRYLLAHEIAHTFQFELKSSSIIDKFYFLNGSLEQEYFCDFIARAILLPNRLLASYISKWNNDISSLKSINEIIKTFNVEYDKCLIRLFNDLNFLSQTVILRFVQFKDDNEWKLLESFATNDIKYNKEYYIPSRNYNKEKKFKDRLPSCGEKLNSFLNKLVIENKLDEESDVLIDYQSFKDKPLEKLTKDINIETATATKTIIINKYGSIVINILLELKKHRLTRGHKTLGQR